MTDDVVAAARRWLEEDPDPDTRAELRALLEANDHAALSDRFGERLQFGTAGLRGALGAGPNRMNRVIVRRAAAGLAAYLLERVPGAASAGVVIGCDARHKSDVFAEDSAAVLAGAGVRAFLLPPRLPTPLLAFAVRHLGCAAGVMVTASAQPTSRQRLQGVPRGRRADRAPRRHRASLPRSTLSARSPTCRWRRSTTHG